MIRLKGPNVFLLLCVIKDTNTWWAKVSQMTVSFHIFRKKQKHSQPDLSGMFFPKLESLPHHHLLPKPDFRCFVTLCNPTPWGFLSYSLNTLSRNYFHATKGWGVRKCNQSLSGWEPPGELHRNGYSWTPQAPDLLNLHLNKPHSQVIRMHLENYYTKVWAQGIKDCALCLSLSGPHSSIVQNLSSVAIIQ